MKLQIMSINKKNIQQEKELKQLVSIFKNYMNINLEINFIHDKDLLSKVIVEGGSILQSSLLDDVVGNPDWLHCYLTDSDWKKLKLRSRLYGEHQRVNGLSVTFGRWHEKSKYKRAKYFYKEIDGIYEHVLGMIHEFIHSKETNMAVSHSYLYGYGKLYTKAQEKNIKPKRNYRNASLLKAMDHVLNLNAIQKRIAEIIAIFNKPKKVSKYSNDFEKAVKVILHHEGGYVNDPRDPGGETNFGISKKSYPNLDIKNISMDLVKEIYYRDYWLAASCDRMKYSSALNVFDMAVNAGVKNSIKLMQKALKVKDDGIIGPITLRAINNSSQFIYNEFVGERIKYYGSLSIWKTYKNGWTNRTIYTLNESLK